MTEWQVLGVIITLLGLVGTMYTMFYKPTHELKIEIVKLNANFESMNERGNIQDNRLNKHSDRIEKNSDDIIRLDTDVKYIKERIN